MKRDDFVDFFAVEAHQTAIHKRLENWAQWCFSRGGSSASPMFRLYQTPDHWSREVGIPVDYQDAAKIAKGVAMLPQMHREALQWNYVTGGSPSKARRQLGVTSDGLMKLIRDGRQMLLNRGV
jgi:DNA-directed RNA polymerase specialized sigma24 family protein